MLKTQHFTIMDVVSREETFDTKNTNLQKYVL